MDSKLLEILACPACRGDVRLIRTFPKDPGARSAGQEAEKIVCTECGRRYPIKDGIPVMLVDEAETGNN